jgi:hypothetical protein
MNEWMGEQKRIVENKREKDDISTTLFVKPLL